MYLCAIYIFSGSVYLFGGSKIGKWILRIRKSLTKPECGNWETEHYNYVSKITGRTISFLEIHNSEPDIYIGFSPALHLQCRRFTKSVFRVMQLSSGGTTMLKITLTVLLMGLTENAFRVSFNSPIHVT